jgi:hypothetical protein
MTRHLLDEVLDAKDAARRGVQPGPGPGPGSVAAWLSTPEGEAWSRSVHESQEPQERINPAFYAPGWHRAQGLGGGIDPCGNGTAAHDNGKSGENE